MFNQRKNKSKEDKDKNLPGEVTKEEAETRNALHNFFIKRSDLKRKNIK